MGEGGEAIWKSTADLELSFVALIRKTSDRGKHMGERHMVSTIGGAGRLKRELPAIAGEKGGAGGLVSSLDMSSGDLALLHFSVEAAVDIPEQL